MNNRAGAEEKHGFEECMSTDMKKGQLGLVKADGNHHKAKLTGSGKCDDFLNVILSERTGCCEKRGEGA